MKKISAKKSKKKVNWKKFQKDSRIKGKVGLGIYVLLFIIGLIVFGKLFGFIDSLGKPKTSDAVKFDKNYSWDGSSTLNIVFKSADLYVVSYNPKSQSISAMEIPEDTYLDLPYNFGRWPARSIYDLGQAENPPMGAVLLKATVFNSFAMPVDGYIITTGNYSKLKTTEVIEKIRTEPLGGFNLLRASRSDLSWVEIMHLFWEVRGIRGDKVKTTDLGQSRITKSLLLSDGSRVLGLDQLRLDQFLVDQIKDARLEEGNLTVGIFNATDHPQLAERAARIITNMGGRVIFTANTSNLFQDSLILGDTSYTTSRLSQVFAPHCFKKEKSCASLVHDPNITSSRAEVNVVLGEDFYLKTTKRPGI